VVELVVAMGTMIRFGPECNSHFLSFSDLNSGHTSRSTMLVEAIRKLRLLH
jgi:hypothetical protein